MYGGCHVSKANEFTATNFFVALGRSFYAGEMFGFLDYGFLSFFFFFFRGIGWLIFLIPKTLVKRKKERKKRGFCGIFFPLPFCPSKHSLSQITLFKKLFI